MLGTKLAALGHSSEFHEAVYFFYLKLRSVCLLHPGIWIKSEGETPPGIKILGFREGIVVTPRVKISSSDAAHSPNPVLVRA